MRGVTAETERPGPFHVAKLPLSSWAFAARTWAAMMLALAAAFWLQLDSASSAAVTVAILAQPRRGQALQKALFRFGATLVGVAASIVITATFTQSRDLFVVAFAAWMGCAVYVASLYDGNRAYGAVLSGYTVAIVAVMQIDAPQKVFVSGMSRLAVVSLGIASTALINDVFAAPDLYPGVRRRLIAAHEATRAMVGGLVRGDQPAPDRIVSLLGQITGSRPDILTLPSEGLAGGVRSAAAASAAVAMIAALSKARAFAALGPSIPPDDLAVYRAAIETGSAPSVAAALEECLVESDRSPDRVMLSTLAADICEQQRLAAAELEAMLQGRAPERHVKMPAHRSQRLAFLAALRVFFAVVISAVVFILSSWPLTSVSFSLVGVIAGLSATTPDAYVFAKGAIIAMPLAVVVAGITEFFFLDGADAFALLAMGMAPAIFGACFMIMNPKTAGLGLLLLVFVPVIFAPSNPQDYSPQTYVFLSALATAAVILFSVLLSAFFPVSSKDRRRWIVDRARADLLETLAGRSRRDADQATYLTADRIVLLARLNVGLEAAKRWRISYTLLLSVLTILGTRCERDIAALRRSGTEAADLDAARIAVARLDPVALRGSAAMLLKAAPRESSDARRAAGNVVADLQLMAHVAESNTSVLRHLQRKIAT